MLIVKPAIKTAIKEAEIKTGILRATWTKILLTSRYFRLSNSKEPLSEIILLETLNVMN